MAVGSDGETIVLFVTDDFHKICKYWGRLRWEIPFDKIDETLYSDRRYL